MVNHLLPVNEKDGLTLCGARATAAGLSVTLDARRASCGKCMGAYNASRLAEREQNAYLAGGSAAQPVGALDETSIVDHPSHYTQFPVEVIEITERLNFCLGNVVKYVCRADFKGRPLEDLKKAAWYLQREIDQRSALSPTNEESA